MNNGAIAAMPSKPHKILQLSVYGKKYCKDKMSPAIFFKYNASFRKLIYHKEKKKNSFAAGQFNCK